MTGRILAIGLAVIVLLGGTYAWWTLRMERAMRDEREEVLRSDLAQMRNAIAKFKQDRGRYPYELAELVPTYIRRIPADPITHQVNWKVDTEEGVAPSSDFAATAAAAPKSYVLDVHSAAGPPYSDY